MQRHDPRPKTPIYLFVLLCVVLATAAQADAVDKAHVGATGDDACRGMRQFTRVVEQPVQAVFCALPSAASAWIARRA